MILEEYIFLNRKILKKKDLSKRLGISTTHLNNLINGSQAPSLKLAKRIEEVTEGKVSKVEALFPEDFQNNIFKEEVVKDH